MKIPKAYERYLTGTFEQAHEIKQRGDYLNGVLQDALNLIRSGNTPVSTQTRQLLMDQAERVDNAQNNRQGACQCLAIKWLKLKMKEQAAGKTGKTKVDPTIRLDQLREPPRLDKVLKKMSATNAVQVFTRSFEEAMNQFHVTAQKYWDAALPLTTICKTIESKPHAYFVVGINCPNLGGNHAIAVYTSDGGFAGTGKHGHVFDPNIGEIKLPLKDFSKLFRGLLYDCYGTPIDGNVLVFAQIARAGEI